MLFSNRTNWHRQPNKLSELLHSLRNNGKQIVDLTVSNPPECGFDYPENEIISALSNPSSLHYEPNPRGLLTARETVCEHYQKKNIIINPSNTFLTASTSEAYSILFKLLCNPGDSVIVPKPSYPLFDYLAQLNDVQLQHYNLRYDGEWHIDIDSLKNCIIEAFAPVAHQPSAGNDSKIGKIKAIVIVNPHNPTGMFVMTDEYRVIKEIAHYYNLAIIVDEVFIDYPFDDNERRITSTANENEVLTFTMNGISKMIGLPQMKLGWIIVSGQRSIVNEAIERLEIICDTFLSVNTPVQIALQRLFEHGKVIQQNILERIRSNYSTLKNKTFDTPCSVLTAHGGWYGIISVPRIKTDEEWSLQLLEKKGIYVHPGYFFDFDEDGHFVVSLLTERSVFKKAISVMVDYILAV